MKIEVLFPEFCNLYGDLANMKYLQKCLPEAEFIETAFDQEPVFVKEKVNLIYLGPMTETMQERAISKLKNYRKRLQEVIDQNTVMLLTGNSLEIFGNYIEKENGEKIEGLGIFPIHAKRDMMHRWNDMVLGKMKQQEDIEIVGFKNQFTQSYGENTENPFVLVEKGTGLCKESKLEGIQQNNCIATYLLGPILIINPLFTKYILSKMGVENPRLAFETEVMEAYEKRLEEFKRIL